MRRVLLPFIVVLVVLTGCGNTSPPRLWGAFAERGVSNIPMKPGRNVRMFTDVNLDAHGYIKYDKATGHFTLEPGSYRVDGWSLTTFGFTLTPEQRAAAFSAPGNAFLWNVDKNDVEILASVQDPLYSSPSTINGVVKAWSARRSTTLVTKMATRSTESAFSLKCLPPIGLSLNW